MAAAPSMTSEALAPYIKDKTSGDERFGGDLLWQSFRLADASVHTYVGSLPIQQRVDAESSWDKLVREVIEEYSFEREILENNLEIKEYRPRTSFSIHPSGGSEDWKKIRYALEGLTIKYLRFNMAKSGAPRKHKKLSILIPIENGYRRTFRSLACLAYDIQDLLDSHSVEFHVCVNFSDDNSLYETTRFANTMARSRDIPLILYSVDKLGYIGSEGRQNAWWKSIVLNIMLQQIAARVPKRDYDSDLHFLHFGDDDIFISPHSQSPGHPGSSNRIGASVLQKLIEKLSAEPNLQVISACYTSYEERGFSAISSVRKRPEYVERAEGPIINLYGGCMTTRSRGSEGLLRWAEVAFI